MHSERSRLNICLSTCANVRARKPQRERAGAKQRRQNNEEKDSKAQEHLAAPKGTPTSPSLLLTKNLEKIKRLLCCLLKNRLLQYPGTLTTRAKGRASVCVNGANVHGAKVHGANVHARAWLRVCPACERVRTARHTRGCLRMCPARCGRRACGGLRPARRKHENAKAHSDPLHAETAARAAWSAVRGRAA
eukprot:3015566-Pleurochrysis_carterae.AAC.1